MDITELLAFSVQQGASDLHLSAGLPPMIRVDGDIRRVNVPPQDHPEVQALIYDIMNDRQRKDFEEFLETDFSFDVPNIARFRVNAFNQNRGAGSGISRYPLRGSDDGRPRYGSGFFAISRCYPGVWCWSLAPQVRVSPLRLQRWLITSTTTDTTIF